jgi:hypothetical protein
MAGNAKPRGAVRKSKKGPTAGTGGNNKRRLEGKGPTPKAEDRPYHAAAKRKKAAEKPLQRSQQLQHVSFLEEMHHVVKSWQVVTQFLKRCANLCQLQNS